MMQRTALLAFVVLAGSGLAGVATAAEAAEPATGHETPASLAFLVGEWTVATRMALPNGKEMTGEAEFSARPILDGRGVETSERQRPLVPGRPVYTETAILYADPDGPDVQGASLNSLGNRKLMEGEFRDGELVLIQTGEMFGGRSGKNRLTWFDIGPNAFSFRLDSYDAAAETWKTGVYSYTATRAPE